MTAQFQGVSARFVDAIFAPSADGLSDKQRADAVRDAQWAAERAAALAAHETIQSDRDALLAAEAHAQQARVELVNAALEDLRSDGLAVSDQLGLIIDRHGRVVAANTFQKRRSDAAFGCYDRCWCEGVTDLARAGDIFAEILGLLD
jgi:type II secretory pathway pseudopilin PulG